ncbi:MAG: hypothetical protein VCG02_01455 [Verrucomicrobiota bacterium]
MSGCWHILAQAEQPPGGTGESLRPLLTWLVFMVIWVIFQLKQRQKKKLSAQPVPRQKGQGPPQGPEQASTKPIEAELRNFMNELLGRGSPRDTGPTPTRPPHRSHARAQAHRDTVDSDVELFGSDLREVQDPPATRGQRPPPLPQPEPVITFDPAPEAQDDIFDEEKVYGGLEDIPDITDIVDIEYALEGAAISDSQNLINPSNFIIDLASLSVPIMSTQMISQRPVRTKSSRPRLTTRKAFRSAVIGHLVLGPPTALSEDVFRSNPGNL